MAKHKSTKACDISKKVRLAVHDRDDGLCVICRRQGFPNAHYIPRSALGLGIVENVVSLCVKCHGDYDDGDMRDEYGERIAEYLRNHYDNWDNMQLTYKKGM